MPAQAPELSPLELYRLLSNMIRTGRVEQVRTGSATSPARCRVRTGELLTTWVPWVSQAAGGSQHSRHWRTPASGEPCVLLAPSGDLAQAVALPGLFSDEMPQGAASEDVERHDFSGTDFWEHDRTTSTLRFEIAAAIELKVGASVLRITPEGSTLATPAYKVDSPSTEFTGAVTVQKLLTFKGGMAGTAAAGGTNTIQGGMAISGGSLTHNGKSVGSTHTHANAGAGVPN